MPKENIYLEATDVTPLIGGNEDAFTLRNKKVILPSRPKKVFIKVFLVISLIAVIIAVIVNSSLYTEQIAEYKKVTKEEDKAVK